MQPLVVSSQLVTTMSGAASSLHSWCGLIASFLVRPHRFIPGAASSLHSCCGLKRFHSTSSLFWRSPRGLSFDKKTLSLIASGSSNRGTARAPSIHLRPGRFTPLPAAARQTLHILTRPGSRQGPNRVLVIMERPDGATGWSGRFQDRYGPLRFVPGRPSRDFGSACVHCFPGMAILKPP